MVPLSGFPWLEGGGSRFGGGEEENLAEKAERLGAIFREEMRRRESLIGQCGGKGFSTRW